MKIFKSLVFLFVLFFVSQFLFSQGYEQYLEKLDIYFQSSMQEWEIPGMAIAIVKDDTVIFAKGYGVRNIEKTDKVDENTMFGIASNTKAFTSAALAILVDEKKIKWDDKVTKYLPYFEMYNSYVTKEMTIRDLLCHRSGLKTFSGDLLWHSTSYSRKDIIERIKFLKPIYGFRSHFGYSNLMFLTAGEIISEITGISYDEFLQKNFFTPLEMKNTNTSIKEFENIENLASPHVKFNDEIIPIKYISWDNIAPAGGINSSVMDMCKWIKLQLHRGIINDKTYFSKEASHEMWTPQTIDRLSATDEILFPTKHFTTYGLGWDLFDYHGRKIVNHSGGLDGMISQLVLVPEENLGFIILTNSINYLPYTLMYNVLDVFFEEKGKDYSSIFLNFIKQNEAYKKDFKIKTENERNKELKPSFKPEEYAGTYRSDLYGDATVKLNNDTLVLQFVPAPEFTSKLEHWQFDTFTVEFKNFPSLPSGTVDFIIDASAEIHEMRIEIINPDFDFTELKFIKIK